MRILLFSLLLCLSIQANSVTSIAIPLIQQHEGFVSKPYYDNGGITIGYGTNLSIGITEEEALILLQFRLEKLRRQLLKLSWYQKLSINRKAAILDLTYNVGFAGLHTFKNMIWCLKFNYYHAASNHLKNSLWYTQTGRRGKYLVRLLYDG